MKEIWGDVPGWDGYYQASNLGRVRSLDRYITYRNGRTHLHEGTVLTPASNGTGYHFIYLQKRQRIVKFYVHRLAMLVFVGECPDGKEVNHKNGDKADNQLSNLEYVTKGQNRKHAYDVLGAKRPGPGERNNRAKLTGEQVLKIREMYATGKYTQVELGKKFGIGGRAICAIVNRENWSHI